MGDWSHVPTAGADSPTTAKRRRLEFYDFSSVSSCSGTPSRGPTPDTTLEDSVLSTPTDSPSGTLSRDFKQRYKKDELWPAIQSNYQYLMDDEIIETCKSTESDLSWDEEDAATNTKVSFTEFMQQYKELTDWLNQIQLVTQRKGTSHSEKYLNQAYHEELLQSSPRRKVFNDYAKQLLKRYPSLKEEITLRLQHLNSQWQVLQETVVPQNGLQDPSRMLKDLESDLSCIRAWLTEVEGKLSKNFIKPTWTVEHIQTQLKEHQVLQREIESQSKVISAVLKLSERLQNEEFVQLDEDSQEESNLLQVTAVNLERRWHNVWLRSLEWQCRLEDALKQIQSFGLKPLHSSDPSLWHEFENNFLDGFNSDDQVEKLKDLIYSDQSDTCGPQGNSSDQSDTCGPQGNSSDQSDTCEGQGNSSDEPGSSDVIPFYDDEYEKIQDLDDPDDKEVQWLSNEMHERNQSSKLIQASSLTRSHSNLSEFTSEIMDTLDDKILTHTSFFNGKMKAGKSESRDIGYSSEGYSNDEQLDLGDLEKQRLLRAPSLNGLHFVNKQVSYGKSAGLLITTSSDVVRRRPASLPMDGNVAYLSTNLNAATKESPWRHSITSAYDTSSNCGSDPEALINVDDGSSIDPNAESVKYKAIINSPTKDFYKMITVDTDFSTDGQLSSNDHSNSPKQTSNQHDICIDIPDHTYTNYNQILTNQQGSKTEFVQSEAPTHHCPIEDNNKLIDSGLFIESLERGVSSPLGVNLQSKDKIETCLSDEYTCLGDPQIKSGFNAKPSKPKSKRKLALNSTDSNVTDTSSPRSGTDSLIDSSCEASGEETSDEEISDDFSTASDEFHSSSFLTLTGSDKSLLEKINHSATDCSGMHRSTSSYSNSETYKIKGKVKSRRSRRERPWSMVGVSDVKKQLSTKDSSMFISESAIDSVCNNSSPNLPSFTSTPKSKPSPSKHYATFPREKPPRPRHLRRTKSIEKQDENSAPKLTNYENITDARHLKRKTCPVSILVSSPDLERNRSFIPEEVLSSLALIEGLEQIKVYSSSSSGSDTDLGAYLTPKQCMSESASESDGFVKSTGSFSETAWDNYQDPLYPTASEAPTEEPLHWEPQDELEFEDEEFKVDGEKSKLTAEVIAERSDKIRSKERKLSVYPPREDDSDSDLEDLHHMIQQSVEQLQVTDSSLKKQRKDPMGTGISLDPSKYAEHILTCQTNVKCLLEVLDLPVISGHEAHQIEVLLKQWKQLQTFAMGRHEQSQTLCRFYGDLTKVKVTVSEVMKDMVSGSFEDVSQLEQTIKTLQAKTTALCRDNDHLRTVVESINQFSNDNPSIHMEQFKLKSTSSCNVMEKMAIRCQSRVKELEGLLRKWYLYQEKSQDLSYVLNKERKQLQLMEFSQSLMLDREGGELQAKIQDLRVMSSDFETYKVKLNELRELKGQLNDLCSEQIQKKMAANMSTLNSELYALTNWCEENFRKLVEKEGEETIIETLAASENNRCQHQERSFNRIVSRLLKGAAPVVVMATLMYLAMPESWEDLQDLGFTISPQLHYPNGGPPL